MIIIIKYIHFSISFVLFIMSAIIIVDLLFPGSSPRSSSQFITQLLLGLMVFSRQDFRLKNTEMNCNQRVSRFESKGQTICSEDRCREVRLRILIQRA